MTLATMLPPPCAAKGPGALTNRKGALSLSDVGVAHLISKLSWLSVLRRVIVCPGSDYWFHIGAELLGVLQRSTPTVLSSLVCLGFADGRYRVRVVVLQRRLIAHELFKNAISTKKLLNPQALVSTVRWPSHVIWAGSCCLSLYGVSVEPGSKVIDSRGR